MAVTVKWYTDAMRRLLLGGIVWKASGGSTVKVALVNSSYPAAFNQDTHVSYADVSSYEVSGAGYSTGGATVTLSDPTTDNASNECRLDLADVVWTGSTITASGAVVYKYDATASLAYLIAYIDFGESKTSDSSTFTVTVAATGLLKITAA
jgi:hypothetical protein